MIVDALVRLGTKRGATARAPDDDYWYQPLIPPAASGVPIDADSALRISAVYACVRILAETVASLPLRVYERLPDGGKRRAPTHPLYRTLHDSPNGWQTSLEFRELMTGHLVLRGNAFAYLEGDAGGLELVPLHPDRVRVFWVAENQVGYEVLFRTSGQWRRVNADDVLHLRGLSADGLRGMSPVELERNAFGNAAATDIYAGKLFANGARPGGVLEHPAQLTDKARAALLTQWEAMHRGADNAHRTAILEEGMKWHEVGLANDDAQFIENRKYNVIDIARIFRVPPHMIGDLDRATFSNVEQQAIDFVVHTVRPWLVRWEQSLNRTLLGGDERYFVEFLVDGLLRGDAQARSAALQTQFMNGALSPDEWREIENRNPLPDGLGQGFYVPVNLQRLGASPTRPPPAARAEDGPETAPDGTADVAAPPAIDARSVLSPIFEDAAERIANAEIRELVPRAAKAGEDTAKFLTWARKFYTGAHADYVSRTVAPLARAWHAATGLVYAGERVVAGLTAERLQALVLAPNVVQLVEAWQRDEHESVRQVLCGGCNA